MQKTLSIVLISLSLAAASSAASANAGGGSRGGVYPLPYASAPVAAKAADSATAEKASAPVAVDKNLPSTYNRTNGGHR